MQEYDARLQRTTTFADDLGNMINQLSPDVVPKPKNSNLLETFMLFKLNDPLHKFHYATARCQKRSMRQVIKRMIGKHPQAEVLLEIGYTPNAKNIQPLKRVTRC